MTLALAEAAEAISAPMVAALEAAWNAIRTRNPDVPPAVVILGAGSIGAPAGALTLGHFAPIRWQRGADTEPYAEIFIGGEGLARGATDVLGTLLHEATHAVAHVRRIKDTSRQGRYHNERFKTLGEELGITVEKVRDIGWSSTSIPEATRTKYADVIGDLAAALTWYRSPEGAIFAPNPTGGDDEPGAELPTGGDLGGGRKSSNNPLSCQCQCPRKIRVSPSALEVAPIICGACETEFLPISKENR